MPPSVGSSRRVGRPRCPAISRTSTTPTLMARRAGSTAVPVFVDTVYWLAVMNRHDHWHHRALEWSERSTAPLVTTEAVLTEVADALSRADRRRWAVDAIRAVRNDPAITVAPGSPGHFAKAFDLYAA